MNIRLQRIQKYNDHSEGLLYIDGQLICFTLEDEKRVVKVKSETRIPAGIYEITLRTVGGLHNKYANNFASHKGMLWLRNVPGFEFIYIHIGNTDDDTAGCILVGLSLSIGNNMISSSRPAYHLVYKAIIQAIEKNERVFIQVVDELH
jgi:hypothetical protein